MPLYTFKCNTCEELHEILIKMNDKTIQKCDKCQEVMTKIIVGPSQFVFKGEGTHDKGTVTHGKKK